MILHFHHPSLAAYLFECSLRITPQKDFMTGVGKHFLRLLQTVGPA